MRKSYSSAFKAKVVTELLREQKTLTQIASDHGVHPNLLAKWRQAALDGLPSLFERDSHTLQQQQEHEQTVAQLYQEIGRLTLQNSWLKKKSGLDPEPR